MKTYDLIQARAYCVYSSVASRLTSITQRRLMCPGVGGLCPGNTVQKSPVFMGIIFDKLQEIIRGLGGVREANGVTRGIAANGEKSENSDYANGNNAEGESDFDQGKWFVLNQFWQPCFLQ